MTSSSIFIGIDPGITGAIAVVGRVSGVDVWDTPTVVTTRNGKTKADYMPAMMAQMVHCNAVVGSVEAFIERVGAMPGQGVTSMFGFGKGYGLWLGILAAYGVKTTIIEPQAWKKAFSLNGKDKDQAREVAQRIFPHASFKLTRKRDIGRADAMLIAEYGRIVSGGSVPISNR